MIRQKTRDGLRTRRKKDRAKINSKMGERRKQIEGARGGVWKKKEKKKKKRKKRRPSLARPREDRRQIESEPVHPHLHRPVAQTVQNKGAHHGVVAVHRVPAPRVVVVLALGGQHVVHAVVQTAERKRRTSLVALRGVVENDVQDDLEGGGVHAYTVIVCTRVCVSTYVTDAHLVSLVYIR